MDFYFPSYFFLLSLAWTRTIIQKSAPHTDCNSLVNTVFAVHKKASFISVAIKMARGNISRGMSQKHIKNNLRVHLGPYAYRSHSIKMQTEIAANSQLPTFKSNKLGSIPDLDSADPGLTCFYFPDCDRPFQKHREGN